MSMILEEWPYAYVVSNAHHSQYCHYCFRNIQKLLRCSQCRFAHYCDANCQKSAWIDHKRECECLQRVRPKIPTDTVRLVARIVFKLEANESTLFYTVVYYMTALYQLISLFPEECGRNGSDERSFKDLISHCNEIRQDILRNEHFAQVCFVLNEYLGKDRIPQANHLLDIFGKICVNSFSILNDDMMPIGVAVYIKLSQLDHSCLPNSVVVFSGPKAILNSLNNKPTSFDPNKLTISYIELLATTSERQSQLKSQYYFDCSCDNCNDTDNITQCCTCGRKNDNFDDCSRIMQHFKWELENLETVRKLNDFDSLYNDGLIVLHRDKNFLSDYNVFRIRLLDQIFDACLELEKFNEAVNFIEKTIDGYKKLYPQFHPSLGLQLLKLGKLYLYLQRLQEASTILEQAENNLLVSFGENHSLYKTAKDLLNQCKEEMRVNLHTRSLQY